jgi:hypothetical protein
MDKGYSFPGFVGLDPAAHSLDRFTRADAPGHPISGNEEECRWSLLAYDISRGLFPQTFVASTFVALTPIPGSGPAADQSHWWSGNCTRDGVEYYMILKYGLAPFIQPLATATSNPLLPGLKEYVAARGPGLFPATTWETAFMVGNAVKDVFSTITNPLGL